MLLLGSMTEARAMENRFLTRLCSLSPLGAVEQSSITRLIRDARCIEAKGIVCHAGEPVEHYPVMLAGWAARCQLLLNGERQITGLLLPGDIAYSSRQPMPVASEEIIALSPCSVAFISRRDMRDLIAAQLAIADAMRAYAAVEYAISSAWMVSLGRRSAFERLAHLLCELQHRIYQDEEESFNSFCLPLSQSDLADALGLTPVHVNRKLQALRQDCVIKLKSKNIEILNLPFLKASAYFDPGYLDHAPDAARQLDF